MRPEDHTSRLSFFRPQRTIHASRLLWNKKLNRFKFIPARGCVNWFRARTRRQKDTDRVSGGFARSTSSHATTTLYVLYTEHRKHTQKRKRDPFFFSYFLQSDPFLIMSSDNDTTRATPANDAALAANDVNIDDMVSHLTERVHEISTRGDEERNKEGDEDDDEKKVDLQSDNSNTKTNEEEETTNFEEEEEEQKKDVGDSKRTIFIGGIPPYEIDEERVTRFFKNEHEEEVTTKLIPDLRKGCHKGYGFVKFKTQESAERFLERGKVEIDGKTIDVKAANKDSPRYDPNHVNSHNNNNNNVMMMMMNAGG